MFKHYLLAAVIIETPFWLVDGMTTGYVIILCLIHFIFAQNYLRQVKLERIIATQGDAHE